MPFSRGRDARQGIGDWATFYNHRRLMPRMMARRPSGPIEIGCRLAARAYAPTFTRSRHKVGPNYLGVDTSSTELYPKDAAPSSSKG